MTELVGQADAFKRFFADLWSDGRGPILLATASGWFLSMGVRMIYPVLLPNIRVAYDLDLTTAGLLLTVLFLLYGLGQFPGGLLTDYFGERITLTVSTLISAVTLFLVMGATSVVVLFAATALFGLGLSLYAVARYTLLGKVYPEQIGAANGVTSAASDAGQSLLPPVGGLIAGYVAWEFGLGFAIPLFVLAAIALWWTIPGHEERERDGGRTGPIRNLRALGALVRRPSIVRGTVLLIIGVTVWQTFTGFYPTYLIEVKGLSSRTASVLFGLFFGLGVVIQPLSGSAYDQFGIKWSLTAVLGISSLAMAVLPFVHQLWLLTVITVLVSTILGFATITQSYLIASLSDDSQGTGFGLLRTISFSIGAAGPVFFGVIADRGLFDEGFIVLAALAGMMLFVVHRYSEGM